ncbi:MAG: endonuclease III domain-containing protein [Pirellulaceae bacterium]
MSSAKDNPGRTAVAELCRRLRRDHGRVEWPEQLPVLDELIATLLSQNTTNANSDAAYEQLVRRFPTWEKVRRARVAAIAQAIRPAGLQEQKAARIRAILHTLHQRRGNLSLEFLRDQPSLDALAYLRSFLGVGPKTAACVLLFACRQNVLPVDTHIHRLSVRLGLVPRRTSAARAHELLARIVPVRLVLEFHVLLIRHGRSVCHARRPQCAACRLIDMCPDGQRRLNTGDFRNV